MFNLWGSEGVSKDEEKIEELLTRGVSAIFPNADFLRGELQSGKRLRLYLGIDPTAPSLHIGHVGPLLKLRQFQDLGHEVILLIGDFTGMIGDPTDKTATRKKLTREEVVTNASLYQEQAGTIVRWSGKNAARLEYNSHWLSKLTFEEVLELSSYMTVEQLLKRDMFEKRMADGKPIYLHEFLYPLMQGYDSVAMEVDGELGGNDQTFNMLAGRTLEKQIKNKEKFVLAMKLLEGGGGKKMGKTEGNAVFLSDSPEEMFGKVMSWEDGLIVPALELITTAPLEEIKNIEASLASGSNPKDAKAHLAKEIVALFHGKERAEEATSNFGNVPADAVEVTVTPGTLFAEALMKTNLVSSKSELRRLLESGAIEDAVSGEVIRLMDHPLTKDQTVKIGKHRFLKIIVS